MCLIDQVAYGQVQATVNFSVKPSGSQPPTPFPMTAQPAQLIIPPNESSFMAVHFAPTAIRSYTATFEAAVENGGDAATRSFSCELRGEGTLPSLMLEMPQAEKGPQALRFPRLLMVGLLVRKWGYTVLAKANTLHLALALALDGLVSW